MPGRIRPKRVIAFTRNPHPELCSRLAFARQRVDEVALFARALRGGDKAIGAALTRRRRLLDHRRTSPRVHDPQIRRRLEDVTSDRVPRRGPYELRAARQWERLRLPVLPTTTIGSFPQTRELRAARADLRRGRIDDAGYLRRVRAEVERNVRLQEEGSQIWPSSGSVNAPNGGSYTFPSGVTVSVNAGDNLEFVVSNAGSTNYCDSTAWDQTVTKASTGVYRRASDGFTQGWDQWGYQYTTNSGASFIPMTYDTSRGQWVGSEYYCTVFSPHGQEPGSAGCESSRTWQAPCAATMTLGANGTITVAAGCSGNTAAVNLQVFRNGTQIWPASGSQNVPNGGSFTFPSTQVSVNAGDDIIEFVTSDAGSTNYCDGTTRDPSVSGGVPAAYNNTGISDDSTRGRPTTTATATATRRRP